jgi:hypothetical protein
MKHPNDKPNPKRENTLKVPLNDTEQQRLRQFCSSVGQQVAPFVRQLVFAHMRASAAAPAPNPIPVRRRSEWPRHGHVQRFPGRAVVAGKHQRMHL